MTTSTRSALFCLVLVSGANLDAQQSPTVTASCNNPATARANVPYQHALTFAEGGIPTTWTRQTVAWSLLARSDQRLSLATNGVVTGTFLAGPVTFQARVSVTYQFCPPQATACLPANAMTQVVNSAPITCAIQVQSVPPRVLDVQPRTATMCGPGVNLQVRATDLQAGFQAGIGSIRVPDLTPLQVLGSSLTVSPQTATINLSAAILAGPPFNDIENAGIFLANPPFSPDAFSEGFAFAIRRTPQITGVSPSTLPAGVAAVLTVTGQNFIPGFTHIRWEAAGRPPQFIIPRQGGSTTQLVYDIPATLLTAAGTANITLVNQEESNPAGMAYSCVRPTTVTIGSPALTLRSIEPTAATACGPGFTLSAATQGLIAGGQLRWDGAAIPNQRVSAANQTIAADVTPAQLGTAARRVPVTAANPTQPGGTGFGPASPPLDFTVNAPPAISVPNITRAVRGSNELTLRFSGANLIANVTRIRWILGATSVLLPTQVSGADVAATVAAALLANAGTARLIAVNVDAANPNGAIPTTGGNCPAERTFVIEDPTITLTSSSVTTVDVAAPNDVPVVLTGAGFAAGAVVLANGTTSGVTTSRVAPPSTIEATLSRTLFNQPGALDLSVRNPDGTVSGTLAIRVLLPRTPQLTLSANPLQPALPTEQPTLTVTQANSSSRVLEGTVTLTFSPDPQVRNLSGAVPRQALPAFAATSSQQLVFDVPTGAATIPLPMNGRFSLPSIAGTVTVQLTALVVKGTALSVMPEVPPTPVSVQIRVAAPAIVTTAGQQSVRFVNASSNGFVIELDGLATGRSIDRADFEFRVATGVRVEGSLTIQVPVSNDFNTFFQSTPGLESGSAFRLRVPFTISDGDANSVQAVTVTLRSGVGGDSQPVTGTR